MLTAILPDLNADELKKLLATSRNGERACDEARKWSRGKTLAEAWDQCERPDWLLWLLGRMANEPEWPERKIIVALACDCAATALKYVPHGERRPAEAIRIVRLWIRGRATMEQVNAAWAAARTAAWAASDAASAAASAARAAASAARAAASDAASAAAWAASDARAARAAARAAASDRRMADLIRRRVTVKQPESPAPLTR